MWMLIVGLILVALLAAGTDNQEQETPPLLGLVGAVGLILIVLFMFRGC